MPLTKYKHSKTVWYTLDAQGALNAQRTVLQRTMWCCVLLCALLFGVLNHFAQVFTHSLYSTIVTSLFCVVLQRCCVLQITLFVVLFITVLNTTVSTSGIAA